MKRIVSAILAIICVLTLLSACGADKNAENNNNSHIVYFKDFSKGANASATFFNSKSGKSKKVKMKKISTDKKSTTFSCKEDASKYNMVYFNNNKSPKQKVSFNKCVSGWYLKKDELFPYTQGEKINFTPKFDVVKLKGCGYEKMIHIWKPDDYDEKSDEKYSTVYVLDGQNVAYGGLKDSQITESPRIIEEVKAMAATTGNKAIVVAIENSFARDYELVPEIGVSRDEDMFGDVVIESMNGTQFADFVANKLVKYVQKHYNVYRDAGHTSIEGSSLGGMEAWYITMEYPERFGTAGSVSGSFWMYDNAVWKKYLSKKSFDKSSPFLYFYTGDAKIDTGLEVKDICKLLKNADYPKDKIVLHYNKEGSHDGVFWRSVFPEFLSAMTFGRVEPLQ